MNICNWCAVVVKTTARNMYNINYIAYIYVCAVNPITVC
jgi:hypothetical protein